MKCNRIVSLFLILALIASTFVLSVSADTLNPQEPAPVTLTMTGPETAKWSDKDLTYTLSAKNINQVGTMELQFEISEDLLDEFKIEYDDDWLCMVEEYGNGVLTVVIGNVDGAAGDSDLLQLVAQPTEWSGDAQVRLTSVTATAYVGGEGEVGEVFVATDITNASVTTKITGIDAGMITITAAGPETAKCDDKDLTYTISAQDMERVATVELEFNVSQDLLEDVKAMPKDGWHMLSQSYENGVLDILMFCKEGVTGDADILQLVAQPSGKGGKANIVLNFAIFTAYAGMIDTWVKADYTDASVTTTITCDHEKTVRIMAAGPEEAASYTKGLTYTFSAEGMNRVANQLLTFEIDQELLEYVELQPMNDWQILYQNYENGLLKVALYSLNGVSGDGEFLKLVLNSTGLEGDAQVALRAALLNAYTDEAEADVSVDLTAASVTTTLERNIYDANMDGMVTQYDLTRVQRLYGTDDPSGDINGDGVVDIADMILVLNNISW